MYTVQKKESIDKIITKFSKTKKFNLTIPGLRWPESGYEVFLGVANYLLYKLKMSIITIK